MIENEMTDGIAVLTMTHGKANALDIELCDALCRRALPICVIRMQRRWW